MNKLIEIIIFVAMLLLAVVSILLVSQHVKDLMIAAFINVVIVYLMAYATFVNIVLFRDVENENSECRNTRKN